MVQTLQPKLTGIIVDIYIHYAQRQHAISKHGRVQHATNFYTVYITGVFPVSTGEPNVNAVHLYMSNTDVDMQTKFPT